VTREQIETALDRHQLKARMTNGRLWQIKRNGATKTWKTRPNEFRIPIKIGFRLYDYIDQDNFNSDGFVID
jgi:hypothetical protein